MSKLKPVITMDNIITVESEDSTSSIAEIEVPRKPPPPLIIVEDEEIILNTNMKDRKCLLAKDLIETDQTLSLMSENAGSSAPSNNPNHWTSDMIKFYNDDWGNEKDFIVEKLQEKMDKHPSLWSVCRKDKLLKHRNARKSNIKCFNCGQRGHYSSVCPDPPYVLKCHMCGTEGHAEYFCPNSKCLNCGTRSREFVMCCFKCRNQCNEICSRCHIIGHNYNNCPDHWRLFHWTTGTTTVKVPQENIYKPNKDIWCCNCGRRGHYQISCQTTKGCNGFMDSLPFVSSYQVAMNMNHFVNKPNDLSLRKYKGNVEQNESSEKIFRLNPLNKTVRQKKLSLHIKNKLKRISKNKRNRRNKNNKKIKQRFFDGFLV